MAVEADWEKVREALLAPREGVRQVTQALVRMDKAQRMELRWGGRLSHCPQSSLNEVGSSGTP